MVWRFINEVQQTHILYWKKNRITLQSILWLQHKRVQWLSAGIPEPGSRGRNRTTLCHPWVQPPPLSTWNNMEVDECAYSTFDCLMPGLLLAAIHRFMYISSKCVIVSLTALCILNNYNHPPITQGLSLAVLTGFRTRNVGTGALLSSMLERNSKS